MDVSVVMVYKYKILYNINDQIVKRLSRGVDEAAELLENGFDINTRNRMGETALFKTIGTWNMKLAKFLIQHGADVNSEAYTEKEQIKSDEGTEWVGVASGTSNYSILFHAIRNGQEEMVNLLLEGGAKMNESDKSTVVHEAAKLHYDRSKRLVEYVLSLGLNVNLEDRDGCIPLHLALMYNSDKIVSLLLNHGADMNNERHYGKLLFSAAQGGYKNIVQQLYEKGVQMDQKDSNGRTPLHYAAQRGKEEVIQLLLSYGLKPDEEDNHKCSPLKAALTSYSAIKDNVIQLLLSKCVDIDIVKLDSQPILHYLSGRSSWKNLVKTLLDRGANIYVKDKNCETVLHSAALGFSTTNVVELFLNLGLNPNEKDAIGRTPLDCAFKRGNKGAVELLLQRGANASTKLITKHLHRTPSYYGLEIISALHYAIILGYEDIVKLLIEKGADITEKDSEERSALHIAAGAEKAENIIELLLDNGLDVNGKCKDGKSALYFAALRGNVKVVEMLLSRGAKFGVSELLGAAEGGQAKLVKLFLDLGVDVDFTESGTNFTGVFKATAFGNAETVKVLLDYGADVKITYSYGERRGLSLMSVACEKGKKDTVKLLFERGLRMNHSHLVEAIKQLKLDIVRVLLDCGVETKSVEDPGNSMTEKSLLILVLETESRSRYDTYQASIKIMERLLDNAVIKDMTEDDHASAFDYCLMYPENLQMLLDYNIDVNVVKSGKSAVERALTEKCTYGQQIFAKLLTRHIVKMTSNSQYVSQKNLYDIDENENLKYFAIECKEEIERMKNEQFKDQSPMFYDVLSTSNRDKLVAYSRNEKILEAVSSLKYKAKFPIYTNVLINQLKKGVWRSLLFDKLQGFFKAVAKAEGNEEIPNLPHLCVSEIYSYLDNKDLKKLILIGKINLNVDICDVKINDIDDYEE